jgi:hypothetical protein
MQPYRESGPADTARRSVAMPALCDRSDGTSVKVLITNLSYDGCTLTSGIEFGRGETVKIVAQSGEIEAQVRWVRDKTAGVRFLAGSSARDRRRARLGV